MKNEKLVCVYMDTQHETMTKTALLAAKEVAQKAVNQFKEATGEQLRHEDWQQFMKSPYEFTKTVIQSKIEVPKGYKKEAYLDLLELPKELQQMPYSLSYKGADRLQTEYCNTMYLSYNGTDVILNDVAENAITSNNIYVSGSEYDYYKKLQKFCSLVKELKQGNERFLSPFGQINMSLFNFSSYPEFTFEVNNKAVYIFMKNIT